MKTICTCPKDHAIVITIEACNSSNCSVLNKDSNGHHSNTSNKPAAVEETRPSDNNSNDQIPILSKKLQNDSNISDPVRSSKRPEPPGMRHQINQTYGPEKTNLDNIHSDESATNAQNQAEVKKPSKLKRVFKKKQSNNSIHAPVSTKDGLTRKNSDANYEPESRKVGHMFQLPKLTPRCHGSGCALEVNVLEKHEPTCIYRKRANSHRNPMEDSVGSYECVGRLVFRTCNGKPDTQHRPTFSTVMSVLVDATSQESPIFYRQSDSNLEKVETTMLLEPPTGNLFAKSLESRSHLDKLALAPNLMGDTKSSLKMLHQLENTLMDRASIRAVVSSTKTFRNDATQPRQSSDDTISVLETPTRAPDHEGDTDSIMQKLLGIFRNKNNPNKWDDTRSRRKGLLSQLRSAAK